MFCSAVINYVFVLCDPNRFPEIIDCNQTHFGISFYQIQFDIALQTFGCLLHAYGASDGSMYIRWYSLL